MVDRTAARLQVLDCPGEEVAAVLEIIAAYGLHLDGENHTPANQLALGLTYMDEDIACGTATTVAGQLKERAPGTSWEASEEPAHGWLGDLYRYTPALGLWFTQCDSDDTPVFTEEKVAAMVTAGQINPFVVDDQLGRTHESALLALARANRDVVLTAVAGRG